MALNPRQQKKRQTKLPKATNKFTSAPAQGVRDAGQDVRRSTAYERLTTIDAVRSESDVVKALRLLANDERYISSAIFSITQLALTKFKVKGYDDVTGAFSQEVTAAAKSVIASMDTLSDYSQKFQKKPTLRQFTEICLRETALTGATCVELVLGSTGIPDYLQAVAYETISYKTKKDNKVYPVQKPANGQDIDLDIANFFISELHLGADSIYSIPMMKSAIIDTFQNNDFIDDMRRVVNRVGHSRLHVQLNSEKVKATAPDDVKADTKKLNDYMLSVQSSVQSSVGQLSPEDAIVTYDNIEATTHDIGGEKSDYVPLMQTLANMQGTGVKAPPSVLGIRSAGSQSLSNTESLVYLKIAKGIQGPVTDVMSRVMTLAVRLLGVQGYVKFEFAPIELRPEGEQEAYKTMRQSRILEQLSLGMITDGEACSQLDIEYRPDMPELSGTGFYSGTSANVDTGVTDNSQAAERNMASDAPDKAGGSSQ